MRGAVWIGLLAVPFAAGAPKTDTENVHPPRFIAQIDLNQIAADPAKPPSYQFIRSVAFSPDENWIAAAVSTATPEPSKPGSRERNTRVDLPLRHAATRLLLVPIPGPFDRRVIIDAGLVTRFAWSPNSDAVLVEGMEWPAAIGRAR